LQSNAPADSSETSEDADLGPKRSTAQRTATPIADSASQKALVCGEMGPQRGSSANAQRVKQLRIASALRENARSQLLTVSS
jgi:hypothetical protein